MRIIVDLDDLASQKECDPTEYIINLKQKYPDFKVTLFTIYGECNIGSIFSIARLRWIQLAAHGFYHKENSEVLHWDKKRWYELLNLYETSHCFVNVFKAPNWEMSKLGYQVLKDCGWAVAVRESQIEDVPVGMKYYCYETIPNAVHGHTWLMESHEKNGLFNWKENDTFEFVSDNLTIKE